MPFLSLCFLKAAVAKGLKVSQLLLDVVEAVAIRISWLCGSVLGFHFHGQSGQLVDQKTKAHQEWGRSMCLIRAFLQTGSGRLFGK